MTCPPTIVNIWSLTPLYPNHGKLQVSATVSKKMAIHPAVSHRHTLPHNMILELHAKLAKELTSLPRTWSNTIIRFHPALILYRYLIILIWIPTNEFCSRDFSKPLDHLQLIGDRTKRGWGITITHQGNTTRSSHTYTELILDLGPFWKAHMVPFYWESPLWSCSITRRSPGYYTSSDRRCFLM